MISNLPELSINSDPTISKSTSGSSTLRLRVKALGTNSPLLIKPSIAFTDEETISIVYDTSCPLRLCLS